MRKGCSRGHLELLIKHAHQNECSWLEQKKGPAKKRNWKAFINTHAYNCPCHWSSEYLVVVIMHLLGSIRSLSAATFRDKST